jgi:vancomycin resistance protein YoaR
MAGWSLPKAAKKELKKKNKAVKPKEVKAKIPKGKDATVKKEAVKASMKKPLKIALYTLAGIALFISFTLLVSAVGVYAYKSSFETKALYGTKILGQDVGGKNLIEVRELVAQRAGAVSLNFSVDGQNVQIKPAEAGVIFNPDSTATQALRQGKVGKWYEPWVSSAASLVYRYSPEMAMKLQPKLKNNLALEYTLNEQKLAELTQSLSQSFNVESKNAGLVMNGTEVQVIPAVYGKQIITDSVKLQIAEAVRGAQSANIAISVTKVSPSILEADTQKSIEAAKVIINTPVRYSYNGASYFPDKPTIGGWIVFNTTKIDGKDQLVPVVDSRLVYPYIYGLASKINIPAVNKKLIVKNTGEQIVEQEGKDGLAVDINKASQGTAQTLTSTKAVDMPLPTYTVKAKTMVNDLYVADWSKYITVNLTTQTMCAYLAGGDKQACWAITSGATGKGYYTPTGTFKILRKAGAGGAPGKYGGGVCMPNPPSTEDLCGINYVSYFTTAGHAIHEAWWSLIRG